MKDLLVELALGLRAHVLPLLGSHARRRARAGGRGGDVTFAIDEEAECLGERFLAERAPEVAFYSEDRGLVSPPSGDPDTRARDRPDRRHAAGDGGARVLLRVGGSCPAGRREPDDGRRLGGCVVEIKTDGGVPGRARRGLEIAVDAGGRPTADLSQNTDVSKLFWTLGFRGRPAGRW